MHADRGLRLGLIGIGAWGCNYVRTITAIEGAHLAAVLNRRGALSVALSPDCRVAQDWGEFVAPDDLDGVIVATTPATHAEFLVAAAAIGLPVLVEKPLTQGRQDADRVRAALFGKQAIVRVEHTYLYHPGFRALLAEAARLGPVRSIVSSAGNFGPYRDDVPVLWDWGAHDLAMCLTLVPGTAHADRLERLDAKRGENPAAERLRLRLRLAGDVPAEITVSTLDPKHRWFAAALDDCTLAFREMSATPLMRYPPGADIHSDHGLPIEVGSELPLTQAVLEFMDAIRRRDRDQSSLLLGLQVVDLLADFSRLA
jgi:predicted dehydrogenase